MGTHNDDVASMMSEGKRANFYDEFSPKLVRDYVLGNRRVDAQLAFLRDAIGPSTKRILVLGCGSGEATCFIARRIAKRARILGIDISPSNIRIAEALFPHKHIEYRCADALKGPIQGDWEVVVLPDVYEHIPADARAKLHANLKRMLGHRGRVLLTIPSPGHQAMLRREGKGLQIVDETVTLSDLTAMADDLGGSLTYFSMVTVFRTNDYIHAVIEPGADQVGPINIPDRLALKRVRTPFRAGVHKKVGRSGKMTRAWRRWRVARLLPDIEARKASVEVRSAAAREGRRPLKIAFFVARFPVMSETFILNQITGLIDRGHDVDIFAGLPGDTGQVHREVISYSLLERTQYLLDVPRSPAQRYLTVLATLAVRLFTSPKACMRALLWGGRGQAKYSLNLFYAMKRFLPAQTYDVIHCHFGPQGLRAQMLRDIGVLKGPLVTVFHGSDITEYVQQRSESVYSDLFDKGDLFLPISENWKRRATELGCPSEKLRVHHMGIDVGKFAYKARSLGGDGRVRIVTVARLVEKKGVEYGIRAVARLCRQGHKIRYAILGDGPLRTSLERLLEEMQVGDAVELLGWKIQDEVRALLDESHILLAPSVTSSRGDQEGIPVVLMEALAMGLPVVSTFHSGIPELVQDGISGHLVPERDVDALSEKLAHLIEHPEVWPEMGSKGRAFVEQEFDIDKLNEQLIRLFGRLPQKA